MNVDAMMLNYAQMILMMRIYWSQTYILEIVQNFKSLIGIIQTYISNL